MQNTALAALIACWILWVLAFVLNRPKSAKDRRPVERAPEFKRGVLLQAIAFFVAWIGRAEVTAARFAAAMLFAAIGIGFAWTAMRHLGKQWQMQAALFQDHELVQTGPYRVVRHPIYFSMFAMLLATACVHNPWPLFVIAVAIFLAGIEIRTRAEDRLLAGRFGLEFDSYRARVKAYLPGIR